MGYKYSQNKKQILFLFTDGFEEKLLRVPLVNYFPDYSGQSYDAACDYILHRFVSVKRSQSQAQIYAHYSSKTDTQQVKCEFSLLHVDDTGVDTRPSHAERNTRHIVADLSPRSRTYNVDSIPNKWEDVDTIISCTYPK